MDARNVLPLPPIGGEARLQQPGGEIEICERKARGAFQPCSRARETAVPVGVRLCADATIRHRHNATFRRQPCVALEVAAVRGHASIHSLPGVHRANPEVCLISPIIHRLQPDLDAQQHAVVGHLEGPLLVIAGPGAGKTRAVVWRAVNLLLQGAVNPAELALCTFSKRPPGNCASGLTPPPGQPAAPTPYPPSASPPCTACAGALCPITARPSASNPISLSWTNGNNWT